MYVYVEAAFFNNLLLWHTFENSLQIFLIKIFLENGYFMRSKGGDYLLLNLKFKYRNLEPAGSWESWVK